MPSRSRAVPNPVGVQLIRQSDIARRASLLLATETDSTQPHSSPIAKQITGLRQQSAAIKQAICGSLQQISFIEGSPEDSLRLTSALDALIESIEGCSQVLSANPSGSVEKIPAIGIACNLIFQCVNCICECLKRLDSYATDPAGHERPVDAVRSLESEITRITRRDLSREEEHDPSRLAGSQQTFGCIQVAADRSRDLANLLEVIALKKSGLIGSRRLQPPRSA